MPALKRRKIKASSKATLFCPCGICRKNCQKACICCDICNVWYHPHCESLNLQEFEMFKISNPLKYTCTGCFSGENDPYSFTAALLRLDEASRGSLDNLKFVCRRELEILPKIEIRHRASDDQLSACTKDFVSEAILRRCGMTDRESQTRRSGYEVPRPLQLNLSDVPLRTLAALVKGATAMKYVLVSGGVISGIGKGVIASSLGMILKSCGIRVTSIKIDPYINIDAGTFSPYEHGEVFVLDDGGEVDLDLGNYERFLDITLHRDNNITTGKIYQHVINRERRGDYLGKTVQVVPHITDAVQEWVERVAKIPVDGDNKIPEVCIVELGGTIGDIEGMPFIEAFRQFFHFRVKREDYCCVHVSLVPQPGSTGEQKTKPTQQSVRELRGLGLSPDIIVCRCQTPVAESVKSKISLFCHVEPQQVFSIHDVSSIYRVPLLLTEQGVSEYLMKRLHLNHPSPHNNRWMLRWKDLASRHDQLLREVTIALVGKYTQLEDAYASVIKALQHSALCVSHRLNLRYIEAADLEHEKLKENPSKYHEAWHQLVSANGILVPGGFGIRGTEGKILAANWARTKNVPYLGVCLGLQCAVIEFARNALSMEGANSTELDSATKHPVVIDMPEHNTGQMGGTMRLGKRKTVFNAKTCITKKLYGNKDYVEERHRHRYEVNPKFIQKFEDAGMKFVGRSTDGERMEIMELEGHQYFVGVQYHPEYISRPMKPSPPYLGLLLAATGKMQAYRSRGYRMSPHLSYSEGNEEDDEELAEIVRNLSTEDVQEASSKDSSPNEES